MAISRTLVKKRFQRTIRVRLRDETLTLTLKMREEYLDHCGTKGVGVATKLVCLSLLNNGESV